ncbi:NAD-binding protein, partial [Akkermansiaceae bacterium]|nr:NAD-binding protein [Akkermansiaceae bacterium]
MLQLHRIAILSAMLAVCSSLLGVWGFGILNTDAAFLDNVYQALRLFTLEGPYEIHPLAWQLEIARFVAPLSLLLGVVATIFHVSRDLLNNFLLKILRGHVVIAGLNEISADFATDAIATGHKVVVIDHDPDSPWLYDLKAKGAVHLIGDFTDTYSLERARILRASRFFAFSEDDAQNVEAVITLSDLLKQATHRATKLDKPLRCYTLHQDPAFHQAFREHSLLNTTPDAMDVSLVNLDALAARITLEQMPMEEDTDGNICENPHLVIFGYSPISMALLRQALHLGHYRNRKKLPVSLVTSEPDHLRLQLKRYFRQAEHIARIEIITAEDDTPASYLQALETSNPSPESWYTFVCASVHDKQNFTMAQYLSNHAHALP